ncbi:MAG: tRNA (adenosine(37)-N6)-threonylcarbamoyltransferase complex transferase subunit TsaD [Deltaproteobacteria bacterium]|nr:tRNA (adenosine(37)-N6)-threonylcarbamoyltransferase complex transferase subunit TsaD [Deltaproteobacteria bacterium]
MRILGIESSCDETAASVIETLDDGTAKVLSDVIATQIAEHAPYGGVVPELASRAHLRAIRPVIESAVSESGGWDSLDAIAVTAGPGLAGALLIGIQCAKAIALARRLPLVPVNHLHGHLLAVFLDRALVVGDRPSFPFIALVASGGHTALYRVDSPEDIRELGATRDDAAGEAFDKVAKLCGLGYPGGPMIDRLAAKGDPTKIAMPRPMRARKSLEFSFSGLKTAVAMWVERNGVPAEGAGLEDLAASVQEAIVDSLVRKLIAASVQENVPRVVLSGGVAANRGLRARAQQECDRAGISLHIPPAKSCTDNAAMIAYAGAVRFAAGHRAGWDLEAAVRWSPGERDVPPYNR